MPRRINYKLEIERAMPEGITTVTRPFDTFAEAEKAATAELVNHWGLLSVKIRHVRRVRYHVEMVNGRFQQRIG